MAAQGTITVAFQRADFVVERSYGRSSVRARQPGTHARPAAGGVSDQAGPVAAGLADGECARLVAQPDVVSQRRPGQGRRSLCVHRNEVAMRSRRVPL